MAKTTILHPLYFRVIRREGVQWFVKGSPLERTDNAPVGLDDVESYGITATQLVTALFRINGGKPGYYLANLKTKQYYYCGDSLEGVRTQLLSLGIGRSDPMEGKC